MFHVNPLLIRLDISCESSARQKIHMEHQGIFSSKDKSKKNKVSSALIFIWRVKGEGLLTHYCKAVPV